MILKHKNTKKPFKNGDLTAFRDPKTQRFLPGNPGGGRPKGSRGMAAQLKEALNRIAEADGQKLSYEELLIRRILHKAVVEGNERMIELIFHYVEGKPTQRVKMHGIMENTNVSDDRIQRLVDEFEDKLEHELGKENSENV